MGKTLCRRAFRYPLSPWITALQGHGQAGHSLQNMPAHAFPPAQAMAVALGLQQSSRSMESLVTGPGGVPEGSHESSTTGMVSRNMTTMPGQPSMQVPPLICWLRAHGSALWAGSGKVMHAQ